VTGLTDYLADLSDVDLNRLWSETCAWNTHPNPWDVSPEIRRACRAVGMSKFNWFALGRPVVYWATANRAREKLAVICDILEDVFDQGDGGEPVLALAERLLSVFAEPAEPWSSGYRC
jgi:hypothetical protein